jgi:hypothetical protein
MRGYLSIPAKAGRRQQWIVLSVDEDRHCEACEVLDSYEACQAAVDRLNAVNRRPAVPRKHQMVSG